MRVAICLALTLALAVGLSGCYHATIDTGLRPSNVTIDQPFASCWVYGLVPPKIVTTNVQCPHGVAKVETVHSFVNQLVGIITFGIYTPLTIKVTCAEAGVAELTPDLQVPNPDDSGSIQSTFAQAADLAVREQRDVYVSF